jgi:Stimulus-sensing domain/Sensor N-terminal transmembrane domain
LRQLHWVAASNPYADPHLAIIIGALKGAALSATPQPWRTINPYRGLLALREEDGAYFFGRESETAEILASIEKNPHKMIALIGNSGVGKSSLVQAGVMGALKRQRWPGSGEDASAMASWPTRLSASRSWAYLTMRVGENPVRALASAFVDLWLHQRGDPRRHDWVDGWENRLKGRGRLTELLDDTQALFVDARLQPPWRIVLYLDQGEELYASRLPRQLAIRFSEIIADAVGDQRLMVLASQRSDYYGHLQANSALFPVTNRVDVAPLGAKALKLVLTEPARMLGASFESSGLADLLVDAAKDQPGALPLLADHMSELWARMQAREDGVIRIADRSEVIQVSSTLVNRADRFLAEHSTDLDTIKRLFCLRLAHVPREGEPVRRPALRSDCSDIEWSLIEQMSDANWRLLVTGEVDGIAQAEIAHEVLLREWPTVRRWLSDQREFLAWRGEVEHGRREADLVPKSRRAGALLIGRRLEQAENWLLQRPEDIGAPEQLYIRDSLRKRTQHQRALWTIVLVIVLAALAGPIGIMYLSQFRAGLIDARIQTLLVVGEITAAAIASSATVETDTTITIDPERLLELQAGESYGPSDEALSGPEFPINPERVAPLLRKVLAPEYTRARIYDRDGTLIVDSANLYGTGRSNLPAPEEDPGLLGRAYSSIRSWLSRGTLPLYHEIGSQNGKNYVEVARALQGFKSNMVRINERGEVIVSVAVPVQRLRSVRGALMLSTQRADIDNIVASERLAIAKWAGIVLVLALVLSWVAIRTIGSIVRRTKKPATARPQ